MPVRQPTEAEISYELYRLLKNAISSGATYEDKFEFKKITPEVKINDKRADLVVETKDKPFLVIEVKTRAFTRPGPSLAAAVRRSKMYRDKLGARFYAVYDSWNGLIFEGMRNFLIAVFGPLTDEYQARNLLIGLAEYAYSGKKDTLNKLPRHQDLDSLTKRVLLSIAKIFKEYHAPDTLLKNWEDVVS